MIILPTRPQPKLLSENTKIQPGCLVMNMVVLSIRILTLAIACFGTISRIIMSTRVDLGITVYFYFTFQSNLMVCFLMLYTVVHPVIPPLKQKFPPRGIYGAVAMYILATGIIYNILLEGNIPASGFNAVILQVNHTLTPILFFFTWLTTQPRGRYPIKWLGWWFVYPIGYAIFASIEGALTGRFRYFFLDFMTRPIVEYSKTLILVILFFIILGLVLVGINRLIARNWLQSQR